MHSNKLPVRTDQGCLGSSFLFVTEWDRTSLIEVDIQNMQLWCMQKKKTKNPLLLKWYTEQIIC